MHHLVHSVWSGMAPKIIMRRPASVMGKAMPAAKRFKIFVSTPTGDTIPLMVETSDNIGNVKAKLQICSGINCDKQVLIMNGRKVTGFGLASAYGITAGAALRLDGGTVIEVTTTTCREPFLGMSLLLVLQDSDTIGCIKAKIHLKLGINIRRQCLRLHGGGGCELIDELFATAAGVVHGSILLLDDPGDLA
jgi:hypothetical protein